LFGWDILAHFYRVIKYSTIMGRRLEDTGESWHGVLAGGRLIQGKTKNDLREIEIGRLIPNWS
jgi:hypothetical protein